MAVSLELSSYNACNIPLTNETRWDFCRSALVTSATKPTSSKTTVDLWYRKGCKLSPSRTLIFPPSIVIPISCGNQRGLAQICLCFGLLSKPVLIMRTGEMSVIVRRLANVAYRRHRWHHPLVCDSLWKPKVSTSENFGTWLRLLPIAF